jgi:hypothetical protein
MRVSLPVCFRLALWNIREQSYTFAKSAMEKTEDILFSIMDDRTHIRLQRIGLQECYPWWNKSHRCDPYWRLYANDLPGAFLVHQGNRFPLDPGNSVLVPAWCKFGTRLDCPGVSHFYIHFDILNLTRPLTESWFSSPLVVRNNVCSTAVEMAMEEFRAGKGAALLCFAKAAVYACLGKAVDGLAVVQSSLSRDALHRGSPRAIDYR